jgi:multicomponent Na+:H+ antiporter subunit G
VSPDVASWGALACDAISWLCIGLGSVFCMIGGIGMIRMPDFHSRAHAAGITDTLGAGLILVGLMFQAGPTQVLVKLIMVLAFLFITSPTSTHALMKAGYNGGLVATCAMREPRATPRAEG